MGFPIRNNWFNNSFIHSFKNSANFRMCIHTLNITSTFDYWNKITLILVYPWTYTFKCSETENANFLH